MSTAAHANPARNDADLDVIIEWPDYSPDHPLDMRCLRIINAATGSPIWTVDTITICIDAESSSAILRMSATDEGRPSTESMTMGPAGARLADFRARVTEMRLPARRRRRQQFAILHVTPDRRRRRITVGPGEVVYSDRRKAEAERARLEADCEVCAAIPVPWEPTEPRHLLLVRDVMRWRAVGPAARA